MTDKLYATDAYLETCDARVTDVTPLGIVVDRTVAYARGGGQPGDTGTITTDAGIWLSPTRSRIARRVR